MSEIKKRKKLLFRLYQKKNKKERSLTQEEKEFLAQKLDERLNKFDKKIKLHRYMSQPMLYREEIKEQELKKEFKRQEKELCNHEETMEQDGFLTCRYCGEKLRDLKSKGTKEIFLNLFCTHKETIVQNGFEICVDCKTKVKEIKIKIKRRSGKNGKEIT